MTEKQNRPRKYDAVLGGKNSLPVNAAVLGGIEGVKRRLTADDELVRVGAVRDAVKYGEAGLDMAIASLEDESWQVRSEAMYALQEKLTHPKVKPLLANGILIRIYREEFETVTVNEFGEIVKREPRQADYYAEDLGGGVELEMVSIPGGSFLMGSPEDEDERNDRENPQHRVNVSLFFLGKYPVTQQQYEAVMRNNPSYFKGANRPVEEVTWHEAREFCERLSQRAGRQYRLPSEAEWEYACRAGTTTPFYFGETITTDLANYDGNYSYGSEPKGVYRKQTTDVGSFPPNAFGLYDMHGNVWEWCRDPWRLNYYRPGEHYFYRMQRGGSWRNSAGVCRSASRNKLSTRNCYSRLGFRLALWPTDPIDAHLLPF